MKIFIVSHKKFTPPEVDGYIPIQVGKGGTIYECRDDINDNISNKNESYCELTAAYWIWKNVNDQIVGITHYRRYFYNTPFNNNFKNILDKKKIKKILSKYDIIVPRELFLYHDSVYKHYKRNFNIKDYDRCREIIKNKYPEYIESFDVVSKGHMLVAYNMMIAKKEIFDQYHQWLFDILFDLEKNTDISSYDSYNKRIYGFISERLFTVWLQKNQQYKIKKCVVLNTESKHYFKGYLRNIIKGVLSKSRE